MTTPEADDKKTWELEAEEEFRFEVDAESTLSIRLVEGKAELFGAELTTTRPYTFTNCKLAIFTWVGCSLVVAGNCHAYKANETPMVKYVNVHAVLNKLREQARAADEMGPRIMIVGPQDSGKTSVCKMLLNYAIRAEWKPTLVDLDVGQNMITIPGVLAATSVEYPLSDEKTASPNARRSPLAYFFGHSTPSKSVKNYMTLAEQLAQGVNSRCEQNADARPSGVVINTCGWVDDKGYDLLLHAAKTFAVDAIVVLEHDRLYNQLKTDKALASEIKVMKLPKSGGVVKRDRESRRRARNRAIQSYFYGPDGELSPHQKPLTWGGRHGVQVFGMQGAPQVPSSALPIGTQSMLDPDSLVELDPAIEDMLHDVLAVSYAQTEEELMQNCAAGYVYVTSVDNNKQMLTVLTPAPGPLPSHLLLKGSVKWFDGQ